MAPEWPAGCATTPGATTSGRPASLLHTRYCTVYSDALLIHQHTGVLQSLQTKPDLVDFRLQARYVHGCASDVCVTTLPVQAKWQWRWRPGGNGGGGGGHPALLPGCLQPGLPAPGAGERVPQGPLPPGEPHCPSLPIQTSWPW